MTDEELGRLPPDVYAFLQSLESPRRGLPAEMSPFAGEDCLWLDFCLEKKLVTMRPVHWAGYQWREPELSIQGWRALSLRRCPTHTPTTPSTSPPVPLTHEDAAILKVLFGAKGVCMTVREIVQKTAICDRTIRTRIKALRGLEMVEEPITKKGFCLTAAGQARVSQLPPDAGAKLLRDC